MDKLVTIIMPTYKGTKVIEKAILSLINQTYQNLEIIIIDDNGKNSIEQINTEKIVQKYLKDKRVKYIVHETNKNGSAARNTGIKISNGKYIAFIDDDDEFSLDKIEKQVAFLDNNSKFGMVYTGLTEIYKNGHIKHIYPKQSNNFLLDYLCCKLYVCSSSIMIKKQIINKIGFWDESFKRHQDMEYICRIASQTKVGYIEECLVLKNIENRNLPIDGKLIEQYRIYYLLKMENLINSFPKKIKKDIYFYNYIPIGKAYIKSKNYSKAIYYAFKSRKPIRMFYTYLTHGFKYIKRMEN